MASLHSLSSSSSSSSLSSQVTAIMTLELRDGEQRIKVAVELYSTKGRDERRTSFEGDFNEAGNFSLCRFPGSFPLLSLSPSFYCKEMEGEKKQNTEAPLFPSLYPSRALMCPSESCV